MLDRATMATTTADLRARHGVDLKALVGRTIGPSWVAWDATDESWFEDEAVIVQIGDRRLEVVWMHVSSVSITWDTIDRDTPPAFVTEWNHVDDDDGYRLEWRRDALEPLRAARGHVVDAVTIAEMALTTKPVDDRHHPGHTVWLLHAIELHHTGGTLVIFNDLDQNGVAAEAAAEPFLRRVDV